MRDGQMPLKKSLLNQPKLTLESVTRKHAGLYICTADNGIGRPAIGAVYIRVLYSPEIETPKIRVHGGVGYKSQLIVIVHADPKPEIKWRIGQKLVTLSDRVHPEMFESSEHRLIFNSVKPYDFNTYTIEANNSLGFDIKFIEFSGVPNAPILARWETEMWENRIGEDIVVDEIQVTLFWALECYSPLIDYRLFFRVAPLPQTNSFDEDKSPPWTELTIPADQDFSQSSFLHTKSFTLRGLKNSTIYEAAVKARNRYGWSPLSSVCYFATFPNSSSSKSEKLHEILSKANSSALESEFHKSQVPIFNKELDSFKFPNNNSSGSSSIYNFFSYFIFHACLIYFAL